MHYYYIATTITHLLKILNVVHINVPWNNRPFTMWRRSFSTEKVIFFSEIAITPMQQESFNYYKKNSMSIELVKDDHLQKVNFRVKNKVSPNIFNIRELDAYTHRYIYTHLYITTNIYLYIGYFFNLAELFLLTYLKVLYQVHYFLSMFKFLFRISDLEEK